MHAYVFRCVCASIIFLDALRHRCWDFLSVYECAYMHMNMCLHVCVYIYMYMYICVSVYMYAYTCIYTRVWVWICTRIGAFCSFVLSNPSTTCVCITCVSWTPACVCGGGLEGGGFSSLFMVCACCWRGRLCFGRGRDRDFVLCISLFLRVLRWWVGVCLYTHVHTHELLGYLMWAQVYDGQLESLKNPDRLKCSISIDVAFITS